MAEGNPFLCRFSGFGGTDAIAHLIAPFPLWLESLRRAWRGWGSGKALQ